MSQKTNLNISPYYDDFDKYNNFYKVLFKPGHPVQARELTTIIAKRGEPPPPPPTPDTSEVVKPDEEDSIIDNRDWVYETKSFVILPGIINEKNSQNVQNEKLEDIIIVEVKKQDLVIKEEIKNITVEKLTLDRIKYSENGTAILF